jgi:hypothetical protein
MLLLMLPLRLLFCAYKKADFYGNLCPFFHDAAAFAAAMAAPLSLSKCLFPGKSLPIFFTMLLLMLPLRLFFFSSKMPISRGISAHFFHGAAASVVNYLAPANVVVVAVYLSNYSFDRRPCVGALQWRHIMRARMVPTAV